MYWVNTIDLLIIIVLPWTVPLSSGDWSWGQIHRRLIQKLANQPTNMPLGLVVCSLYSTTIFTQLFTVNITGVQTTVLVQFLPSVKSPDTVIFFCNMCFQSFTLINVVVQTWLCAAARPSGFAVIVVTSNLLIPDTSLWLGINGQPLETRRTHQTYWKKVEVHPLENLTVILTLELWTNSSLLHIVLPGHYLCSAEVVIHNSFNSVIGTIVGNKSWWG